MEGREFYCQTVKLRGTLAGCVRFFVSARAYHSKFQGNWLLDQHRESTESANSRPAIAPFQ